MTFYIPGCDGNTHHVCENHNTFKAGGFADQPLEYFIGKTVQLRFPIDPPHVYPNGALCDAEQMWVHCLEIRGDELFGELANDPDILDLKLGDFVFFEPKEVGKIVFSLNPEGTLIKFIRSANDPGEIHKVNLGDDHTG